MLAQKKDKAMITGQGRWGLYIKRPSQEVPADLVRAAVLGNEGLAVFLRNFET